MSWRISTVSEELGVPAVTLRAWERRYGFPKPERTDSNYRTYSDDEVKRLRHVLSLMRHGVSVSEAITSLKGSEAKGKAEAKTKIDPAGVVERFFEAAAAFDERGLEDLLALVMRELPAARACDEVLMPILRQVSDRLDIAREHLASRVVRNALVQLANVGKRRGKRPPLLLACPEGEEHEGGLLSIAVHLRLRGENLVILGTNTPTDALVEASKRLRPAALCLSLVRPRTPEAFETLLRGIVRHCPVPIVIVGGSFARVQLKRVFAAGAEYAENAEEVLAKLEGSRT